MGSLTQYWKDYIDYYASAIAVPLEASATRLNDAFLGQKKLITDAQDDLLRLEQVVATARRELAGASPSDAVVIVEKLREDIVLHRRAQRKVLDLVALAAQTSAELTVTFGALERERKRRTQADAELTAAESEEKIRANAKTLIAQPPLSTIAATALAALTGPEQQAAKTTLDVIPAGLFELAEQAYRFSREGVADATALASDGAAAIDEAWTAREPAAGKVAATARAFRNAEHALLQFAGHAESERTRAMGLLESLKAGTVILSQAEFDEAKALDTATHTSAANQAGAVITAAEEVDAATVVYTTALLTAQAPTPFDDVSTQGPVVAAKLALDEKVSALATAQQAMTAVQADLDDWTRIVPDSAWRKLRDYFDALSILEALTVLPGTLVADVEDTETLYAAALGAATAAARTQVYLEDIQAIRQAALSVLEKQIGTRIISAMRNDAVGDAIVEDDPAEDDPIADARVAPVRVQRSA